jgi:hypothetical protein
MTLPLSNNAISMGQVNTELNLAANAQISLNDPAVRTLLAKTGDKTTISLADGWGKSNIGAVTNLAVTNGSVTVMSATVTWTTPATGTITKYEIYAKDANNVVKGLITINAPFSPIPTSATVTGMASNTAYTIYVTTSNTSSSATASATVPVTTLAYNFPFTTVSNVNPNTVTSSTVVSVGGLPVNQIVTVSVSGSAGAQFAAASTQAGATSFTSTSGLYTASSSGILYVAARVTSGTFLADATATVTVGDGSSTFTATTRAADISPSNTVPIIIPAKIDVPINSAVTSEQFTITGLEPNYTGLVISASAGATFVAGPTSGSLPSVYVNSGTFTVGADTNIYIKARVTSSSLFGADVTGTYTIGSGTATFKATTTSNAFTIPAKTGQAINTLITSDSILVTGLEYSTSYQVSVANGSGSTGAAYEAVTGTGTLTGTFTSSTTSVTSSAVGEIRVQVRVQSSTQGSTTTSATLSIGSYKSGTFSVTTPVPDTSPTFGSTFAAITNVPLGSLILAAESPITVTSLEPNYNIPVSVTGGYYYISSSTFTPGNVTFINTDSTVTTPTGTLYLGLKASANSSSFLTDSTATVTIGSGSTSFKVTTTTGTFSFTTASNLNISTSSTSNVIAVNGLPYPGTVTVSIPNADAKVDAGTTTSMSGTYEFIKSNVSTVQDGTGGKVYLAIRGTSSDLFSTTVTYTASIAYTQGTKSGTYSIGTRAAVTQPSTQFTFTDLTGQARSSTITSSQISITVEPNYTHTITATTNTGTTVGVDAGTTTSMSGSYGTSKSVTTDGTGVIYITASVQTGTAYSTAYNCTITVGTMSDTFTATTLVQIIIPGSITLGFSGTTSSSTTMTISAGSGSAPDSYYYERYTDAAYTANKFTGTSQSSNSFSVSLPSSNTTYYIKGFATNTAGTGSGTGSVTSAAAAPTSASIAFSSIAETSATLTVTSTGATTWGYQQYTDANYNVAVGSTVSSNATNSFGLSSLTGATYYYFKGYGSNTGGSSPYSAGQSVLTVPGSVSVTASTPVWNAASSVYTYTISLSYTGTVSSWIAYRGQNPNLTAPTALGTGILPSSSFSATSAVSTTTYYSGKATNASGTSASYGPTISVTVGAAPITAPSSASIASSSITETTLTLTITSTNATTWGYQEYTNSNYNVAVGNAVSSTSTNSFGVTGRTGGSTYYYAGFGSNASGTSPYSTGISVLMKPSTPTLTVSSTPSWNATTSKYDYSTTYSGGGTTVSSYKLYQGTSTSDSNPTLLGSSIVAVGVTASTSMYLRATAVNTSGESSATGYATITAPAAPITPAAPTITFTAGTGTGVTVTISSTNATAYKYSYATTTPSSASTDSNGTVTIANGTLSTNTTYYFVAIAIRTAGGVTTQSALSSAYSYATPAPAVGTASITISDVGIRSIKGTVSATNATYYYTQNYDPYAVGVWPTPRYRPSSSSQWTTSTAFSQNIPSGQAMYVLAINYKSGFNPYSSTDGWTGVNSFSEGYSSGTVTLVASTGTYNSPSTSTASLAIPWDVVKIRISATGGGGGGGGANSVNNDGTGGAGGGSPTLAATFNKPSGQTHLLISVGGGGYSGNGGGYTSGSGTGGNGGIGISGYAGGAGGTKGGTGVSGGGGGGGGASVVSTYPNSYTLIVVGGGGGGLGGTYQYKSNIPIGGVVTSYSGKTDYSGMVNGTAGATPIATVNGGGGGGGAGPGGAGGVAGKDSVNLPGIGGASAVYYNSTYYVGSGATWTAAPTALVTSTSTDAPGTGGKGGTSFSNTNYIAADSWAGSAGQVTYTFYDV